MPRITDALEVLARITGKLENNAEDHKRLHFRITAVEDDVRGVEENIKELASATATNQGRLEEKFNIMYTEHLTCITTNRVRTSERRKGLWSKIKLKIEERVVDIVVWLLVSFTVWMVLNHMVMYSASGLAGAVKKAVGGE